VQTDQAATVRGDAAGRRRDILTSAEQILAESGYPALTMRAIAAGAGVSPGTVYQYFGGKEDVFAALMARRLDELQATMAAVDRSAGIAGVLRAIVPQVTELWQRYGRSAAQWEAKVLAGGRRSRQGMVTSATVYRRTITALGKALADAAAANGQRLVEDPAMPYWVWDSLIGLADDVLLGGARQGKVAAEQLIAFATEAIERGILAPVRGSK
jgi:AcrR family transcriptional regulator